MPSTADFTGDDLVVGEVNGYRCFRVDSLGRLTGVAHRDVWRPGVNEAKCHSPSRNTSKAVSRQQMLQDLRAVLNNPGPQRNPPFSQFTWQQSRTSVARPLGPPIDFSEAFSEKHVVADVECECGYYAYYDPNQSQYTPQKIRQSDRGGPRTEAVSAIVQASGKVTMGSKGFRAQKAEIVALIEPRELRQEIPESLDEPEAPEPPIYTRKEKVGVWLWQDHRVAMLILLFGLVAGFSVMPALVPGGLLSTIMMLILFTPWVGIVGVYLWTCDAAMNAVMRRAHYKRQRVEFADLHDDFLHADRLLHEKRLRQEDVRIAWNNVTVNYPDVPVYPTLAVAVRAHPLSSQPTRREQQESPEDFWTKEAP